MQKVQNKRAEALLGGQRTDGAVSVGGIRGVGG